MPSIESPVDSKGITSSFLGTGGWREFDQEPARFIQEAAQPATDKCSPETNI